MGEFGTPRFAPALPRARNRVAVPVLILSVALLFVGHATGAAPKAPIPTSPGNGVTVDSMPAFAWTPVAAAEEYEFQIAADAGFSSPVFGRGKDDFRTKNTRATLTMTAPNGTYWWRVRAIRRNGSASAWSSARSFHKNWGTRTTLLSPVGGATITYPTTPFKLTWAPMPGARKYLVSIATDPQLSSLIPISGQAKPVETTATSLTPVASLADGETYYWGVTPVDAEGDKGVQEPSNVAAFTWSWPSTTTVRVADLVPEPELYDPRFSWDRVPGAARYEVEINPSIDFAPGSKVCCSGTTINTSLSPTMVLKDNAYYLRVRAIEMDGYAGIWNCFSDGNPDPDCQHPTAFTKTFDNIPPVTGTSIKQLRMRDNEHDLGQDTDAGTAGYQTEVPILSWDPVPGASSYEVDVTPYNGAGCLWSATKSQHHFTSNIALTSWTPLGAGWNQTKPYPDPHPVATEFVSTLTPDQYCARVRARSDRAFGQEVYGDYTYLDCSTLPCTSMPNDHGWAFEWTGYPVGGACTPSCNPGYLGAGDYLEPVNGTTVGQTPLFTWRPVSGAHSYFVIVAKDSNFTNIVDYAFTQLPAYAPRGTLSTTTYSDEVTLYYWAVLPEAGANGTGTEGDPLAAAPQNFYKRSTPPAAQCPPGDPYQCHLYFDEPTFQWGPVPGARTYRLQISQDPTFVDPIDDITTDSTAYFSNTTYPADPRLYWRVRANDENGVGLTWSLVQTFQKALNKPDGSGNATQGDLIPTWSWGVVPGAVSYDISVDLPNGTHKDFTGLRTPAVTPLLMYGTGIFHWKVRAEFPHASSGLTPGPYSDTYLFTHTIKEPTGAHADFNRDHILLSWNAKPGAKRYRVQISGTSDFGQLVENVVTDNTSFAPLLKYHGAPTLNTGRLYWRVAAIDEGDNVGDFTQPQLITRMRRMEVSLTGSPKHRKRSKITVMISDFETYGGVPGAKLRLSGAGIVRRTRTDAHGTVRLTLRPKRRGTLVISATKRGYQRASARFVVR